MNYRETVTELIYDAIRESTGIERGLALAPATVLVGETSKLDSLAFVNLVVSIEEHIERRLHRTISVMDLVLGGERLECTVDDLAAMIAETFTNAERAAAAH